MLDVDQGELANWRDWTRLRTAWHADGVMQATWFHCTADDI